MLKLLKELSFAQQQQQKIHILCMLVIMYIHCVFNRQTLTAELEQKSNTITQLQGRFRNVVSEKKVKETELTKELEDSVSTLGSYAQQ